MSQNNIKPEQKTDTVSLGGMMKHVEKVMQRYTREMVGIPNQSEATYYTQQEADAYNAELTGALNSTTPLTAEEAAAYNEAVTGATKEAGDTLSSAEAAAYNATLEGAVSTSDIKTPAVPTKVKKYVDDGLAGKAPNDVFGASGTNHKKGLVPDPGATAGTTKYLREDGTWVAPPNTEYESKQASQGSTDVSLVTTGEKYTWGQKQDKLTFDNAPVQNSNNPVKSGGLFTALEGKQDTITDRSFIGDGSAVCSTDAATQEKAVTITNFVLLKYGFVSVRFQKGVKVAGATLKINDNAAKAILIEGVALPAGVIRENVTALMQYDGTNFNIVSINAASVSGDGLLVDLGLPSGLKWATRNIDVTQPNGFAASPFQYDCSFFSWGNTEGHNPIATNAFEYNWGNSNDVAPYKDSPGATIDFSVAQQAGLGYDAAHVNLGDPWKMPNTDNFAELFDANNTKYIDANGDDVTTANNVGGSSYPNDKRVVVNGCVGLYLESKRNGKRLFFPASGYGSGASWSSRGAYGYYWSSSLHSAAYGRGLGFGSAGVYPQYSYYRFYGFPVRAVQ